MKILHLLWDGHSGGTQRVVKRVAESDAWSPSEEHGICLFNEHGVEIHSGLRLPVWWLGLSNGFEWHRAAKLRHIVDTWQPDLLHLHCDTPAFLHQAGRYRERPLLYTEHGDTVVRDRNQLGTRLCWSLARRHVDRVLLNSRYSRDVFVQKMPAFANRCQVVPNPLLEIPPPRPPRRPGLFRIGLIGRLHPVKGFDRLFEALKLVAQEFEIHVYGDGPEKEVLRSQAAPFAGTRFHGFTDRPLKAIGDLDLLVVPSRREAFGLTVLEAQAMGTPVIAHRTGGLPERIDHGRNGLLCDCSSPEDLADAIERMIVNPPLREALAREGRITAARQGLEAHVATVREIYLEMIRSSVESATPLPHAPPHARREKQKEETARR